MDGLRDPDDLPRIRRLLRLPGSPPVLGALPELPAIRRELAHSPTSRQVTGEMMRELAHHTWTDWSKKSALAKKAYDSQIAWLRDLGLIA